MSIQVGERLPVVTLTRMTAQGPASFRSDELFAGKRVLLFALPGAFTPTCSERHLPGYVERAHDLRKSGIDSVVCLSVNDAFVMDAWGKSQNVGNAVQMIADGNGDFALAIGLEEDRRDRGMGLRSQRYAMLVEDGVVKVLNVEPPGELSASSAEAMLEEIGGA